MDGAELAKLAVVASGAIVMWTVFSAEFGRRMARFGRRWIRRMTITVIVLLGVGMLIA